MPSKTKAVSTTVNDSDVEDFIARVNHSTIEVAATDANAVRRNIILRQLQQHDIKSIIDAANIGVPTMENFVGRRFQVRDFVVQRTKFRPEDGKPPVSEAYVMVDVMTADGESHIAAWGGVSVVDTLVILQEGGHIPFPEDYWATLVTNQTGAGYTVYKLATAE